ncbi:putative 3-hydroxybutyryl-CoA dehydrogenase OS=Afipia felis OX=1035 GN=paaH_3 PE=4 SV=1 [Afipia felis]
MTSIVEKPDLIVGVVGTGTMGRGIIQVTAAGGMRVVIHDSRTGAADDAKKFVSTMLQRLAEKQKMTADEAKAATDRISVANELKDLAACDVVVEVIVEKLDAKQALFSELEKVVRPDAILASNTSSLSITSIASHCQHPERIGGLHFFNPVPLMKLVEVIGGARTAPWVIESLTDLGKRMTRQPVVVADSPGFLVNHIGRAFVPESLRIVDEGIATPSQIDGIMKDAAGFRMGPFQLFDMVGADVAHPVMESLYDQFYQEPMYRPSPTARRLVEAGMLGRKTGAGFYRYRDGNADIPAEPERPASDEKITVWLGGMDENSTAALRSLLTNATIESGKKPSDAALCVIAPIGMDMASAIKSEQLDPSRTVALDTLFGIDKRCTIMTSPATAPRYRNAAVAMFDTNHPVTVINDSPGFVAQRIAAMIVNVGCTIAQLGISPPADIDLGARLGLGYALGPLELGDKLGPARVLQILDALYAFYHEPRYRASPWLRRRANLGLSLRAPEQMT